MKVACSRDLQELIALILLGGLKKCTENLGDSEMLAKPVGWYRLDWRGRPLLGLTFRKEYEEQSRTAHKLLHTDLKLAWLVGIEGNVTLEQV